MSALRHPENNARTKDFNASTPAPLNSGSCLLYRDRGFRAVKATCCIRQDVQREDNPLRRFHTFRDDACQQRQHRDHD